MRITPPGCSGANPSQRSNGSSTRPNSSTRPKAPPLGPRVGARGGDSTLPGDVRLWSAGNPTPPVLRSNQRGGRRSFRMLPESLTRSTVRMRGPSIPSTSSRALKLACRPASPCSCCARMLFLLHRALAALDCSPPCLPLLAPREHASCCSPRAARRIVTVPPQGDTWRPELSQEEAEAKREYAALVERSGRSLVERSASGRRGVRAGQGAARPLDADAKVIV